MTAAMMLPRSPLLHMLECTRVCGASSATGMSICRVSPRVPTRHDAWAGVEYDILQPTTQVSRTMGLVMLCEVFDVDKEGIGLSEVPDDAYVPTGAAGAKEGEYRIGTFNH